MPLTRDQFGLAEKVLNELQEALTNAGVAEPFTTAAAEAEAVVNTYTSAYELSDDHAARLQRALAIYDLYFKLGNIPAAVQTAYDNAMTELRDIRDGKFPGLASSSGGDDSTGSWGSQTRLTMPGDPES